MSSYVSEFYCLAIERTGRKKCEIKDKMCDISILKKECRECLEKEEGLKDIFIDFYGDIYNP